MKRIVLCIFVSLLLANVTFSQNLLQRADTAFVRQDYSTAIELYKDAIKKMNNINVGMVNFRIAEAYRFGNNYSEALTFYDKAIRAGYNEPAAIFNYAEMLMIHGDYVAAKNYYQQYQIIEPDDIKVLQRLASIELATGRQDPPIHAVTNARELNTRYSEYGVAKLKNNIIFASSRMDRRSKVYQLTGQGFSNFYTSTFNTERGVWESPVLAKGGINSNYNDGTFYFHEGTNTAYFMQCNGLEGNDENCNMFTATYDEGSSTFGTPESFEYNNERYNIGHPAMTSDGNTLFFVSDMPGGKGGSDIWMMKKNQTTRTWGNPINLSSNVNTSGSEMFPFILEDKYLYFASDGHIGLGGLDIYYVEISDNNNFSTAVNMMSPFNSSADDFGIIFRTKNSGLFSSNRTGGLGDDDIYSFDLIPVTIIASGTIMDKENNVNVPGATITLKGSDGSTETTISDNNGNYTFNTLKQDVQYSLQASKQNFLTSEEKRFSTAGIKYDRTLNKANGVDLDLSMIAITREEINIENIYYDYNSAELRQESKQELNKLVNILKENPDIRIMINSHTDSRGTHTYNQDLSNRRAQSVVNYLVENGILQSRLESKGHAFTNPKIRNARTEEEHQANRRTTFNILNVDELQ
ncbi:MAG: OmpA family protein [Bacteroidales bacterium]|nr:OmpA family protein [Bacteroidales bacterium]